MVTRLAYASDPAVSKPPKASFKAHGYHPTLFAVLLDPPTVPPYLSLAPMAKLRFLALLLLTALLALSFSQGMVEARKLQVLRAVRHDERRSPIHGHLLREVMAYTTMDYGPPTANTNTHGGLVPSPDPTSPPTH